MSKTFHERRKTGGVSIVVMILFLTLLLLPTLAILRLAQVVDLRIMAGYAALISVATFFLYKHDKQQAQSGEWRTPESTLHFVELLGGWPGAFLAQRAFRHKISKASYQITFWMIIAVYEFTSFDLTQNWQYSRKAFQLLLQLDRLAHKLPL